MIQHSMLIEPISRALESKRTIQVLSLGFKGNDKTIAMKWLDSQKKRVDETCISDMEQVLLNSALGIISIVRKKDIFFYKNNIESKSTSYKSNVLDCISKTWMVIISAFEKENGVDFFNDDENHEKALKLFIPFVSDIIDFKNLDETKRILINISETIYGIKTKKCSKSLETLNKINNLHDLVVGASTLVF